MTATAVLYLASQSPRRRELLAQIGVAHNIISIDIDESRHPGETPDLYVQRLAREKAEAGLARIDAEGLPRLPVLGADTAVIIDADILGKPGNAQAARRMLERLSGRAHEVMSGVAICGSSGVEVALSRTRVWFGHLGAADIERYCATGEPFDKAGGYGIQGAAAQFIERIEGSYSGVVGLPLFETAALLRKCGVIAADAAHKGIASKDVDS